MHTVGEVERGCYTSVEKLGFSRIFLRLENWSDIVFPVSSQVPSFRAQRLINLEIPVLVRSLKSSNVELGLYLDGRLFKCSLSAAANP